MLSVVLSVKLCEQDKFPKPQFLEVVNQPGQTAAGYLLFISVTSPLVFNILFLFLF